MLKYHLPLNNSLLATNLAKSRLFSARTLYRTICQKLTALNSPLIRRDIASDIRPFKEKKKCCLTQLTFIALKQFIPQHC